MNEMQLSLLGLGLGAIVLVLMYDRWQERKHRQLHAPAPEGVAAQETPVEPSGERQEPMWDQGEAGTASADLTAAASVEPALAMSEPVAALTEAETWVDAIATLRFYDFLTFKTFQKTRHSACFLVFSTYNFVEDFTIFYAIHRKSTILINHCNY